MEQELEALEREPQCASEAPGRHRCTFPARATEAARGVTMHAVYDDASDTVYVYAERLQSLPPESKGLQRVLQRAMELNWELLLGKLEWNPKTGELRLSAVMSTDSNFDRRAFRSLVRSVDLLAARYLPELASLR